MKICILLSTYNGEKYLEEQLESILKQTIWNDCFLYIRDDGSNDNTCKILRKYEHISNIKIEYGNNLGYTGSFATLLKKAPEADYYSFSDQDDYWYPKKLERGISFLKDEDQKIPLLYFSDCDYADKDLNITGKRSLEYKDFTFEKSLFDCWALGFTEIINSSLRELQLKAGTKIGHDHFAEILSMAFGKQIYDKKACAKYRRHENTITTARNERLKIIKELIKKLFSKNGLKYNIAFNTLINNYSEMLNREQKKLLSTLNKENRSLKDKCYLVFYKKRFKEKLLKDFFIRLLFLFDKI